MESLLCVFFLVFGIISGLGGYGEASMVWGTRFDGERSVTSISQAIQRNPQKMPKTGKTVEIFHFPFPRFLTCYISSQVVPI